MCGLFQSSSSSTRSLWQDIAEWIGDSWPWPLSSSQCPPLRVQPADVGFDETLPAVTSDEPSADHDVDWLVGLTQYLTL